MARKKTKRVKKPSAEQVQKPAPTRRDVMGKLAWFGIGGIAILGVGGAFAMDFRNKMAEADLARIGAGIPAIVQIHDPNCALCRDLQRETRAALKRFSDDELVYLVANIQTIDGADFQAQMGLPNVSLVLFNAAGDRIAHVQGVTPRAELEQTFRDRLNL